MALGKRLKQLLDEKNITVKEFAQSIDVAPTTLYSFIKRDSPTGKLELIGKMAKGLDMRIDEFMAYDTAEALDTSERTVLKEWQKYLDLKEDTQKESAEILRKLLDMLKRIIEENDNSDIFTGIPEEDLLYYFWNLNEEGQQKTIEYACDLTENPKYRKKERSIPELNAAHRSKGNFTEEERQDDENMMD